MSMATSTTSAQLLRLPKMEPGSSLRAYFDRVEMYCRVHQIDGSEDKTTVFKNGLSSGDYLRFCVDFAIPDGYEEFRHSLLRLYEPEEPAAVSKDKFLTARQLPNERTRMYCERLKTIATKAYGYSIGDRGLAVLVRDAFCRGLRNPRLKEVAALSPLTDLEDLLEELERHEVVFGTNCLTANAVTSNETTVDQRLDRLSSMVERLAETVAQLATQPKEGRTCFNCGRAGHLSAKCNSPRTRCAKCRGQGHLERFCRRTPVSEPLESCNQVGATKKLCGVFIALPQHYVCSALLDSGAAVSLLSERSWHEIGKPPLEAAQSNLVSANGSPISILGKTNVRFRINEKYFVNDFFVASDLDSDCILGNDFLDCNNCVLDFEKRVVRVGNVVSGLFLQPPDTLSVVKLRKKTVIPPRSEAVLNVFTEGKLRRSDNLLVSAEPSLQVREQKFLVATCLVPRTTDFRIKVLNLSENAITVNSGDIVGKAETVIETDPHSVSSQAPIDWKSLFPLLELNDSEKRAAYDLFSKYQSVFAFTRDNIGHTDVVEHAIETQDSRPVKSAYRRLPQVYKEEVDKELCWLTEKGIIRPSCSPWAAPIVMVRKKDGSVRMCVDYRRLNDVTVKDSYPLPHVSEILDSMNGCTHFSTIDLACGYHQVSLKEDDIPKTAFLTHRGLYEYTRLPFGVCNGPSTFQRLMGVVLQGLLGDSCLCYLDDIITFSVGFQSHLMQLEKIFRRLSDAGLPIKPTT